MTTSIVPFEDALCPLGDLSAYLSRVHAFPMLSAEQEHALGVAWVEHQDVSAARQLVLSHLRYVVRIAKGYAGYHLPQADLIQEGNIGLMEAVRRFNPFKGVRLVSFALHWIKAEIQNYIIRNWRMVKCTTKAQRKLFFNLRRLLPHDQPVTTQVVQDVADALSVSPKEVREMHTRMRGQDIAFDGASDDPEDAEGEVALAPVDYIAARADDEPASWWAGVDWDAQQAGVLSAALASLPERERCIVEQRWLSSDRSTLQDLADQWKISAERVRQLERNALKRLRHSLLQQGLGEHVA